MARSRISHHAIALLSLLGLAACQAATPSATSTIAPPATVAATPTAAPTSSPTPAYRFKAGHYTGPSGVSFDVTGAETLKNFVIRYDFGGSHNCTIQTNEGVARQIEPDGSFVIAGEKPAPNGSWPMGSIIGKFVTPTKVEGEYNWNMRCGDQIILSSNPDHGTWEAGYSEPGATPTPLPDQTQGLLRRELVTSDTVRIVAFSPDGQVMVAGLSNGTLEVWQVSDGTRLQSLTGHTGAITGIAFSDDGRLMASSSDAPVLDVRFWNARTWAPRPEPAPAASFGEGGSVTSIDLSDDGTLLATASRDGAVRLWRSPAGTWMSNLLPIGGDPNRKVQFLPQGWHGDLIAVTDGKVSPGGVWLISVSAARQPLFLDADAGARGGFSDLAMSSNAYTIAGLRSSSPPDVYFWETPVVWSHSEWDRSFLTTEDATSMALSPDGDYVATGSSTGSVTVRRRPGGTQVAHVVHPGSVVSLIFAPDGKTFATAGETTIRLWSLPPAQ